MKISNEPLGMKIKGKYNPKEFAVKRCLRCNRSWQYKRQHSEVDDAIEYVGLSAYGLRPETCPRCKKLKSNKPGNNLETNISLQ